MSRVIFLAVLWGMLMLVSLCSCTALTQTYRQRVEERKLPAGRVSAEEVQIHQLMGW